MNLGRFREVPRVHASRIDLIVKYVTAGEPVVVVGAGITDAIAHKWSPEYLGRHATTTIQCKVFSSTNARFKYSDPEKNLGGFDFSSDVGASRMDLPAFIETLGARARDHDAADGDGVSDAADASTASPADAAAPVSVGGAVGGGSGDEAAATSAAGSADADAEPGPASADAAADRRAAAGKDDVDETDESGELRDVTKRALLTPLPDDGAERLYLQEVLVSGIGEQLQEDFKGVEWGKLSALQAAGQWGTLTTNMLLVGQRGVCTPIHYDEQQNLFGQLHGRKLFVLASPAAFGNLYPSPVGHPWDRQSAVDIRNPDLTRFPKFAELDTMLATVVEPGDLLYIPNYWWHHVESPFENTVSVTFWFKSGPPPSSPTVPLTDPVHLLPLRRNIEKLVAKDMGFERATDFWRRVETRETTAEDEDALDAVRTILGNVLAPDAVDTFIRELVDGRFDIPKRPGYEPPPREAHAVSAAAPAAPAATTGGREAPGGTADARGGDAAAPAAGAAATTGETASAQAE